MPIRCQVAVRRTLYGMAASGKNIAATIFWSKNHLGMADVQTVQGPGGAPVAGAPAPPMVIVMMPDNGRDPEITKDIRERQTKLYGEATVTAAIVAHGASTAPQEPTAPTVPVAPHGASTNGAGTNGAAPSASAAPKGDPWGDDGWEPMR